MFYKVGENENIPQHYKCCGAEEQMILHFNLRFFWLKKVLSIIYKLIVKYINRSKFNYSII